MANLKPLRIGGETYKNLSLLSPADWIAASDGKSSGAGLKSIADAYAKVAWFRAAFDTRTGAVASTPWEITRIGSDEPLWVSGDSPPKAFSWITDFPKYLELTEGSLLTDQHAFFLKVSPEGRQIRALQFFSPSTIEPIASAAGTQGWIRKVNGQEVARFGLDEVVHISLPNVFQEQAVSPTERLSEAKAAYLHAQVLYALDDFALNDLQNGLLKYTLLRVPQHTNEKEKQRLMSWFRGKFTRDGAAELGKSKPDGFGVVASEAVDPITLSANLNDLQSEALTNIHRQGVATALRVPAFMLESEASANRSVAEQGTRNFWENVVIPRERIIESGWNEQIFTPLGYEFKFHPERMEAFQAAELDKADKVALLFQSELVTRNEARKPIDGLDDIEGPEGEEFYTPTQPQFALSTSQRARHVARALQSAMNGSH